MANTAKPIPGTTLFDGHQAQKGYALNKMCYSFNSAENREKFRADEAAYMQAYGLNATQAEAIRTRNVLGLLAGDLQGRVGSLNRAVAARHFLHIAADREDAHIRRDDLGPHAVSPQIGRAHV